MRLQKTKIIFLICIIFLFIHFSCSDQPPKIVNKYPIDSLNILMMNRLNSSRILMLGDAYHGHRYFLNLVIDFLDYWLDNMEQESTLRSCPDKLILFLEADKKFADKLNEYIETDNYYSFLTYFVDLHLKQHLNIFTTDYLKFISELREIKLRIKTLN